MIAWLIWSSNSLVRAFAKVTESRQSLHMPVGLFFGATIVECMLFLSSIPYYTKLFLMKTRGRKVPTDRMW